MEKIAIIGTGLIGTSLGLAIKKTEPKGVEVVGSDIKRGNANRAESMGAIDRASSGLAGAVDGASIVILATPVSVMGEIMEAIGSRLIEGCLVTDTGASKQVVLDWAELHLPSHVNFVGGHPLVTKDASGPEAADVALFQDKPYCVIPGREAHEDSVRVITGMLGAIGAKPYFMDISEHDSFASAVNHLPLLLSVALVSCASKSPSWEDIAQMASSRFGRVSSLASGDPVSYREITLSENENVVHWIDAFIRELYEMRQALTGSEEDKVEALEKTFSQAIEARNRWLTNSVRRTETSQRPSIPTYSEFFLGTAAAKRLGRATSDKDTRKKS